MRFSEKPGLEKDFFRLMRRKFTASEWDFVMKRRENGTKSRKESEEEEEKDFLGSDRPNRPKLSRTEPNFYSFSMALKNFCNTI